MSEEVISALSRQLNQEFRNAYLYLAIATYFHSISLPGFAHYFMMQAREELTHAMKIYEYLVKRGWRVELFEVAPMKKNWSSIEEAIRDFYEAERENTKRIWGLVDLARKHGDKATENFLQWFVNEQVEEEEQAMELLARIQMIKDNIAAILTLDRILAERK